MQQAQQLAAYLKVIEPPPELIFSSPFYRCLQTAAPTADILDLNVVLEPGIGEWYKPTRPVIPEPASFENLSEFFPRLDNSLWKDPVIIPSKLGEDEQEIFERCKSFWPLFLERVDKLYPQVTTVLFITHAASKIALGMSLLGFKGVRSYLNERGDLLRSGACAIDTYQFNQMDDSWKLTVNGYTDHLTDGEEMNWNFLNGHEAGSDEDIRARILAEQAKKDNTSNTINGLLKN